ncbi:MAG TPA: GH116 family glycosyl hydrolase [Pyrinomonadaceae bacterium]|nr:GH116 family glycosyl hydrolase [Pyrinomonadaceae bacterium]
MRWLFFGFTFCFLFFSLNLFSQGAQSQATPALVPKFSPRGSGLELERRTQAGSFFDVLGRRAAVFGYEHRPLEAWVYPMKLLDDFELSFRIEGYPLEFRAADTAVRINVRPEATVFTYSHAAFTVRQIIYAPVDEPGVVMLLDVESVLPMTVGVAFKPSLKLAWPAGLMTGNIGWDEKQRVYYITEESRRFAGVVGSPAGRDVSQMPYQEEPRDVPSRFLIEVSPEQLKTGFIPIVIAGSVEGREKAKAAYDRLLGSAQALYESNVAYYERLERETTGIRTPDERLDKAFSWAKVGVDKGIATNPLLGTGLLAGFRTSGESERPGFAWFFGRDSMWTALALNSYGDFDSARTALEFLKKFQRADGKIPHEISQSASLIPWFTDYEFPWASADATPLYVITHADYWRTTGDMEFLKANWDSIQKAYRFSEATDTDGNFLIENTKFGHGWVEGGPLRPVHEEIYMQGLWIEASRNMSELAEALKDGATVERARTNAERTRAAMEQTYWLANRGFYAFGTRQPAADKPEAEPGPNRAVRQARMEELAHARLIDEDTVLPAVPLWWRTMQDERAQSQLDHLGSGRVATDWGARIISNESKLYDPLSYHYGSVWPLFTGWASMGAYRYSRPHVGYQALMANALLTYTNAEGYVTELLSGDFNAPFGRSSHHQVWSEAMVVTPALRGLFGIEITAGGRELRFAPQLPANWDRIEAQNVAAGAARYDLKLVRAAGRMTVTITRRNSAASGPPAPPRGVERFTLAPAFPLDARVRKVKVQGRASKFEVKGSGDVQRAEVVIEAREPSVEAVFTYEEGTDVYLVPESLVPGARSEGLRVLRARADREALHLLLEGVGGRTYQLRARTPYQLGQTDGVTLKADRGSDPQLLVTFAGPPDAYVRREITIPIEGAAGKKK